MDMLPHLVERRSISKGLPCCDKYDNPSQSFAV